MPIPGTRLHAALCLYRPGLLTPTVVRRLGHRDDAAAVNDGLALSDQLISRCVLEDELLRRVKGWFNGGGPGSGGHNEDSHSPATDFRGPRH